MRNIALVLMYNGTAYHGWQVQKTEGLRGADAGKGLVYGVRPSGEGHRLRAHGCRRPRGALCGQFPYRVADTGGSPALLR